MVEKAFLIPLVVSRRPPVPYKAKLQFDHHVTQAIVAKHHGTSYPFFFADQTIFLSQLKLETLTWNLAADDSTFKFQILDRLHSLQESEPPGVFLPSSNTGIRFWISHS